MKRTIVGLNVIVLVSLLLAACVAPAVPASTGGEAAAAGGDTSTPKKGGILTVARSADANLWDPKFTNDNNSLWAQTQIYATLIQNSPDGKELQGWLAESWENNPEATEFTFKLHQNAKFCDGTQIKASDVKFSLDRAMEADSNVTWQFPASPVVEAVDDLTVKITLNRSNIPFPNYLTLWGSSVLSEAYVKSMSPEEFNEKPLGSGPFCLAEWRKGELIVLKPNPGYWDAANGPYVDEVHLKVVQDDNARVLQVQSGEVDIALDIPYSQIDALKNTPGTQVNVVNLYGTAAIVLNQRTVPQFTDKKVRQAMSMAVDRQALVDAVLFGQGQVAKSPFYGPDILFWTGDFETKFDLESAKKLMAESSAPDGFAVELTIPSGNTLAQQTAVILKDQLAQLKIDVTISPVEEGTWWELWSGGKAQMLYKLGTNDVIDPAENLPFDFWSKDEGGSDAAFTGFYSAEIVKLSKDAEAALDPEKRREFYYELQRIAMDETPQIWLFHPTNRWAQGEKVQGFAIFYTGLHRFWQAWKSE